MRDNRIVELNDASDNCDGKYVLYLMEQAQRANSNLALVHAIKCANESDQSVIVGFALDENQPNATKRQYAFMLEGLAETAECLSKQSIKFILTPGAPHAVGESLAKDASLVVLDRGYLRHQKKWRSKLASDLKTKVVQIETDTVVPVEVASDKAEYAARTIRDKINDKRDQYLERPDEEMPSKSSLPLHVTGELDVRDWKSILSRLSFSNKTAAVDRLTPGRKAAEKRLSDFIGANLDRYDSARDDPANPECSMLSSYLHFGQISPTEIALTVIDQDKIRDDDREAFLEELIVRRELAINFVHFTEAYDTFDCLPDWARQTLQEHADDEREHTYSTDVLISAETHDSAWNAATTELIKTGYMHNHMRMYWGKKILEWTPDPKAAYERTLELNNRYFLDGNDPNSFANVAWVFGLHDQAWQERDVFGKVRYMNANGLERKFDVKAYIKRVGEL